MKIILCGALGRMGHKVVERASEFDDMEIVAAVDPNFDGSNNYDGIECVDVIGKVSAGADCIIDFSFHTSAPEICEFAVAKSLPVVVATTGHDDAETAAIEKAAESVAVFHAGNMSVGVGEISKLAAEVGKFFPDADCEIVETHHNKKVDAPSGTALMIAKDIIAARGFGEIVTGRAGMQPRKKGEISISAVRLGNIVGTHEVIFDTGTQQLKLTHMSHDRALFADGSFDAARFLANKPAGLYKMEDLLCK